MKKDRELKLSPIQQMVIDKMRSGWELGSSHAFGQHCWLQKGRIGEGGQSIDVRYSTLDVLFRRGLIEQKGRRHMVMIFKLTREGRKKAK